MGPPVVLLTDFGWSYYAGVMKGVILRYCPEAQIVDLSHEVSAQNIREGAWILASTFSHFPSGSVFLAIVDPGVGTKRQALAVEAGQYYFVGPDNGLLFPAISQAGLRQAVAGPVPASASATFHGRDVFAPLAGRIAAGKELSQLGTPTVPTGRLLFHLKGREGELVTIDRFGNLITNLIPLKGRQHYEVTITRGGCEYFRRQLPFVPVYEAAPRGIPFLITGSSGTLEISVRQGSAAQVFEAQTGDLISIE